VTWPPPAYGTVASNSVALPVPVHMAPQLRCMARALITPLNRAASHAGATARWARRAPGPFGGSSQPRRCRNASSRHSTGGKACLRSMPDQVYRLDHKRDETTGTISRGTAVTWTAPN
jgi:hypothetical protein